MRELWSLAKKVGGDRRAKNDIWGCFFHWVMPANMFQCCAVLELSYLIVFDGSFSIGALKILKWHALLVKNGHIGCGRGSTLLLLAETIAHEVVKI